jgi:hypothetical protein
MLYPFFFALFFVVSNFFAKNSKFFIIFVLPLCVMFSTFQYGMGDYFDYQRLFDGYTFSNFAIPFFTSFEHGGTGHEFVFASLMSVFSYFHFPYWFFLFVVSIITIGLKLFFFYRFSPIFIASLIIYFSFVFFKDMTQLRGSTASSFILLSSLYIHKKNPIKYIFMVLLASGFHVFSLLALPVYWISNSRYSPFILILLLCCSYVFWVFGGVVDVFLNTFNEGQFGYIYKKIHGYYYISGSTEINPLGFGSIFHIFLILYCIFFRSELKKISGMFWPLFVFYAYGFLCYVIFFDLSLLAYRSLEIFSHTSLALIFAFVIYSKRGIKRLAAIILLFLYSSFFFFQRIEYYENYSTILAVNS